MAIQLHTPEMTFEDVCRAARVAERLGQQPLTLQEQATLYAIKLHAYHSLSTLVQKALGMLDELAGDPDIELTGAEDDFMHHESDGPGCSISDPGGCEHDGREPEYEL